MTRNVKRCAELNYGDFAADVAELKHKFNDPPTHNHPTHHLLLVDNQRNHSCEVLPPAVDQKRTGKNKEVLGHNPSTIVTVHGL